MMRLVPQPGALLSTIDFDLDLLDCQVLCTVANYVIFEEFFYVLLSSLTLTVIYSIPISDVKSVQVHKQYKYACIMPMQYTLD